MRAVLAAALLAVAGAGNAAQWALVPGESRLGFAASYDQVPFEGRFEAFQVRLSFDPESPQSLRLEVDVELESVNTENVDRDETLLEADWFDVRRQPLARYRASGAEPGERRAYRAAGELALKGVSRPVPIEFDFAVEGGDLRLQGTARMRGDTVLDRMDFGVGAGEWSDPELIGHAVEVRFELLLRRR